VNYVRGVEVTVEFDEQGFAGSSLFLFGSVLKTFFQRYASVQSFVDVRLVSTQRGEIMKWSAQPGQQTPL
jgi:type VI secretion system protein ImpG